MIRYAVLFSSKYASTWTIFGLSINFAIFLASSRNLSRSDRYCSLLSPV